MKKLSQFSLLLLAILLFASSCKKNEDDDTDTQLASENNQAETHFDEVFKEVDVSARENNLGKNGPVISIDTSTTPHSMIINYGNGVVCRDGKTRSGEIRVSWTGAYRDSGTVIQVSLLNFYQEGAKVEGSKTITNLGRNSSGQLHWSIQVNNAKITSLSGTFYSWQASRIRTWISGENTPLIWRDDVYSISGGSSGIGSGGTSYTVSIVKNLKIDLSCLYRITEGTLEIQPSGKALRTLDYGSGNCDKTFTVTIRGRKFTINR